MRVLLTGATGFLGSHIAHALVAAGHEVVALVRPGSEKTPNTQLPTPNRIAGDILDLPSLRRAAARCEAVVHAAALVAFGPRAAERQRQVNVEGTRHVLEAAR